MPSTEPHRAEDDGEDDDGSRSSDEPARGRASTARASEKRTSAPPPRASREVSTIENRAFRFVFYFVWLAALPFALAIGAVWLLTPEPHTESTASGLRVFVAEQQIPAGIVLFTIFAMILWRFRHDLPLASAIGVGGRRDIPANARARFEDAGTLVEEAHRILRTRKRDVERELTSSERDQVTSALAKLEDAMSGETFDAAEFDASYSRADRVVGEHLSRWRKGELREYAESIAIAVAVALVLRAFVVEAFKIPSGSMIPTLMIGDHIFVNKFTYGPLVPWTNKRLFSRLPPERGDVMVFKFPENPDQDFIKRVVAIPGDTLEAIDGRPIINGWLVPRCHVGEFQLEGRSLELYMEYLEDKSYFTLFETSHDGETCNGAEDCAAGLACKAHVCGTYQGPWKVAPEEAWVMGDNRNNSHDSRSWHGGMGGGVPFENIKGRAMFVWVSFGPGGKIAWDREFVNVLGRPKLPADQNPKLQEQVDKCLRERPPIDQTTPPPPKK